MANSPVLPFFAHNNTVKAWCATRLTHDGTLSAMTQAAFDTLNFLDGYNLRLDVATRNSYSVATAQNDLYNGAIYFSFINPLPNNKYKVFAHVGSCYTNGLPDARIMLCHCLNSSEYPKTTSGFWMRCSAPYAVAGITNQMSGVRMFPYNTILRVTVL